jgi:2,3-bisphosphoglycerate-dependent phosphoglycerate mutase
VAVLVSGNPGAPVRRSGQDDPVPSAHRDATTDVLLVRHGEVVPAAPDHPHPRLEDGQGDPPLSPLGRLQSEAVGR